VIHARKDYARIQDPFCAIPADEPVFLIRGQDAIGALAVREWARLNLETGGSAELSAAAIEHAELMDAWPKKKHADAPPGTL